jgi:peroxisomal membrane protein 4
MEKIQFILKATRTHATNLAKFVFIYKCINLLLKYLQKEVKQYHALVAAFIGGYFVFGEKNNVNEQVCIFLFIFFA